MSDRCHSPHTWEANGALEQLGRRHRLAPIRVHLLEPHGHDVLGTLQRRAGVSLGAGRLGGPQARALLTHSVT